MKARRGALYAAAWGATTLAWSWPLVWNRFPFLFFDTTSYLRQAAGERAFLLRPVYYSEFLRLFRGAGGLPIAAACQIALVALASVAFVARVAPKEKQARVLVAVVLGGALSPAAFHFSTIMPDAFAYVFALSLAALAVETTMLATAAWAIVAAATGVLHFSFFALGIAMAPAVVLASTAAGRRARRAGIAIAAVLATVALSICANTALAGGGFRFASPGPIFLAARLSQDRTLSPILRRRAAIETDPDRKRFLIDCADEAEQLPPITEGFLFFAKSPLTLHFPHAWTDPPVFFRLRRFCSPLVAEGLSRYPGPFLSSGILNVRWMTAGTPTLANFVRLPSSFAIEESLQKFGGNDLQGYRGSRQAGGEIPVRNLRPLVLADRVIDPIVFLTGTAVLLLMAVRIWRSFRDRRSMRPELAASFVLLAVLVANVLACGFISTGSSRYHERMILAGILGLALWPLSGPREKKYKGPGFPGP